MTRRKKRTNRKNISRLMKCEDSCVSGLKRRYDSCRSILLSLTVAQMNEYGMDTSDVSWLDLKEEEQPRVKTLSTTKRHMVRSQQSEADESLVSAVSF